MKKKGKYLLGAVLISLMIYACTNRPDHEIPSSESESIPKPVSQEQPIDLNGTYDENDLRIITIREEYAGVTLQLPQIDGLTDKQVQAEINRDMIARIEPVYRAMSGLEDVSYNTMANFANVLSIEVYVSGNEEYKPVYLNYNLVDGSRLKFEDLFLSEVDTLEVVRNAFRATLIKEMMEGGYDENTLFKMVKNYCKDEDKAFLFTPGDIILFYKNYAAPVKMLDMPEKIGIYSRFLTEESIFVRDDIGDKGLFTCMENHGEIFGIWEYGLLEDNLWCDFTAHRNYQTEELDESHAAKYTAFREKMIEDMRQEIENYREIAKQNPTRFYIVTIRPTISIESESEWIDGEWVYRLTDHVYIDNRIQCFEMSPETYEGVYRAKLLEAYRSEYLGLQGGIYIEATDDVVYTDKQETGDYNYMTGEKL